MAKLEDLFDIDFESSDNFFAYSKETFDFSDDSNDFGALDFKYKYAIDATYCDGNMYYCLYLVPTPKSLCKAKFDDVVNFSGQPSNDCGIYDVCAYGACLLIDSIETKGEEIDRNVIDTIANTISRVDSLLGFYIDKPQNMAGVNGWKLLNEYINGK